MYFPVTYISLNGIHRDASGVCMVVIVKSVFENILQNSFDLKSEHIICHKRYDKAFSLKRMGHSYCRDAVGLYLVSEDEARDACHKFRKEYQCQEHCILRKWGDYNKLLP